MDKYIIEELTIVANELDAEGLYHEAAQVDGMIKEAFGPVAMFLLRKYVDSFLGKKGGIAALQEAWPKIISFIESKSPGAAKLITERAPQLAQEFAGKNPAVSNALRGLFQRALPNTAKALVSGGGEAAAAEGGAVAGEVALGAGAGEAALGAGEAAATGAGTAAGVGGAAAAGAVAAAGAAGYGAGTLINMGLNKINPDWTGWLKQHPYLIPLTGGIGMAGAGADALGTWVAKVMGITKPDTSKPMTPEQKNLLEQKAKGMEAVQRSNVQRSTAMENAALTDSQRISQMKPGDPMIATLAAKHFINGVTDPKQLARLLNIKGQEYKQRIQRLQSGKAALSLKSFEKLAKKKSKKKWSKDKLERSNDLAARMMASKDFDGDWSKAFALSRWMENQSFKVKKKPNKPHEKYVPKKKGKKKVAEFLGMLCKIANIFDDSNMHEEADNVMDLMLKMADDNDLMNVVDSSVNNEVMTKNALFTQTPIDLEKINGDDIDKEVLRTGIIAEYDAVNLYEQMSGKAKNNKIKEVLLDIAKEEKTHVGEFQALLNDLDPENSDELNKGYEEVK